MMAFADQILDVHEIGGGFWSFNPTMDEWEPDENDPEDDLLFCLTPPANRFNCANTAPQLRPASRWGVLRFNS
jgi:hypothetical protein